MSFGTVLCSAPARSCTGKIRFALLGALAGLTLEVAASDAGSLEQQSSCHANLTCARQASVVSAKDFKHEVPDLSRWEEVSREPQGALRPASQAAAAERLRDPITGMDFVLIPGACYLAKLVSGQSPEGIEAKEGTRKVCIEPFYLGSYEVTFEQYDRFANATSRDPSDDEGWGRGRRPVINVNLYDALSFAKWLSRQTGTRYRLPTEVEWEHAARAGQLSTFPWGDEIGSGRANCDGCGSRWDDESTAPVGSFAPNGWGLYDMIGNVGEWTCSMRDPDPASSFEACDSPYASRRRIYRNGGWSDGPSRLGAHFRDWNAAVRRTDDVGFRLLRECAECRVRSRDAGGGKLADRDLRSGVAQ